MRILLWLTTILIVAVGLAMLAYFNPGNIVLFYPPYRIDVSLNLFLLTIIVLFIVFYTIIRAVHLVSRLPGQVLIYRSQKHAHKSNQALRDALKAYFEGRFGYAEKAAAHAAEFSDNASLAALISARSAHFMQQTKQRDRWLAKASQDPKLKTAHLMTALELLLDDHQFAAALKIVQEFNASSTRHIRALQLALKAQQQAKNWPEVLRLVQILDKRHVLHPALSQRLREMAYDGLFAERAHDAESVSRLWASMPQIDRLEPAIAARAARAFSHCGLYAQACALLERALNANWDNRLIRAYRASAAEAHSPVLLTQIERCETWLAKRPGDIELTVTLGVLCLRQSLWGKAQYYLKQALASSEEPSIQREIHLSLGQLYDALVQAEQAAVHYKQCALMRTVV